MEGGLPKVQNGTHRLIELTLQGAFSFWNPENGLGGLRSGSPIEESDRSAVRRTHTDLRTTLRSFCRSAEEAIAGTCWLANGRASLSLSLSELAKISRSEGKRQVIEIKSAVAHTPRPGIRLEESNETQRYCASR